MSPNYEEKRALVSDQAEDGLPHATTSNARPSRSWTRLLATYGTAFMLALLVSRITNTLIHPATINSNIHHQYIVDDDDDPSCDDPEIGFTCRRDISQYWGQYSPYFSVPSTIPDGLPDDCEITFAQILSRHGARDPTLKRTLKYSSTVIKIQATSRNLTGRYAFLKGYRYDLGADQLNDLGKQQLRNSAAKFYKRYSKLARDNVPFFRTAGQERVVDSAAAWIEAYHDAKVADNATSKDDKPYDMVVIEEGPEFNNTLFHSLCVNLEDGPLANVRKDAKDAWVSVYGRSILYRLQQDLPGVPLVLDDMHNLMSMCPFDTVHSPKGRISPFCDLFTGEEWQQYNHLENLEQFYGWGKGNPLGPTNGIGFTNELIARMLNKPVDDHTATNRTLDSDPKTFPFDKKHKVFADFSHDNDLTTVFFAMNLFPQTPMLSISQVDSIDFTRGWSSAWTVPFAARAYFEKMQCKSKPDEELVRVIINDRVLPLESCGGDFLGRCTLSSFVSSLSFATSGGNWDQCFLGKPALNFELPSGRAWNETVFGDEYDE